ncbi:MAG TPA: PDR/VanB family oxidoreductase [Pseudonocardia sp.]|jgi:ferredoxin-NADP reductase
MVNVPHPRPAVKSRIWAVGISTSCMFALITAMAMARRGAVPAGHVEPWLWWHIGRASGLIAWVLLGVSVIGGMALSTSLAGRRTRSWTTGLHTFVSVLAVVFTAVHLVSVLAAPQLAIGWVQVALPFTRAGAPVAQGLGVLALYLLLAVAGTSWLRGVLPWRWWRRLHLLSFPLFALACAHTVLAGSDATHPLFVALSAAAALVIGALFIARVRGPLRARAGAPDAAGAFDDRLALRIAETRREADGVVSFALSAPGRTPLPEWEPGAHLPVSLPSGRLRHYSLYGDPADRGRYRIAVLRQDAGRGGSRELATLPVGSTLEVGAPRNNFRLRAAGTYLFIAGGIGVTGVLPMARAVAGTDRPWRFVYGGRSRAHMALLEEVTALGPDRLDVVPEDERGRPDLAAIIAEQPAGTAVYCCGPPPLLDAVAALLDARPDLELHVERFTADGPAGGAGFRVELRRTGAVVDVAEDQSILAAVRDVRPDVPLGCEQGVCGACRSTVLDGEPDHRDQLLSDPERDAGQILLCVSRARGQRLELDL